MARSDNTDAHDQAGLTLEFPILGIWERIQASFGFVCLHRR